MYRFVEKNKQTSFVALAPSGIHRAPPIMLHAASPAAPCRMEGTQCSISEVAAVLSSEKKKHDSNEKDAADDAAVSGGWRGGRVVKFYKKNDTRCPQKSAHPMTPDMLTALYEYTALSVPVGYDGRGWVRVGVVW